MKFIIILKVLTNSFEINYFRMYMRILHTMLRVNDLNESIDFYSNLFGMKVLRKEDYPEAKFSLAFIGYGNEKNIL